MPSNSMLVIKYNRSLLSQRDKFANRLGGCNTEKKTEYNLPTATEKQLKEIGKRLKEERKIRMIKVVLLTVILVIGLIYLWVYLADGMVQFVTY